MKGPNKKKLRTPSIPQSLAIKLASIVVHADEYTDPNGLGHDYDKIALRGLIEDEEVLDWIGKMGPLAPLRRTLKP